MELICTPGGETDNSYVTRLDAITYYDETRRRSWAAALAPEELDDLLIQATRELEGLGEERAFGFVGAQYDTSQRLWFPRRVDVDSDGDVLIPTALQAAVCEQAAWMWEREHGSRPLLDRAALREGGVTSISVDGLSETYDMQVRIAPVDIAPKAWRKVKRFLCSSVPIKR